VDPQLLVPLTQAVQQLGETNLYLAHLVQLTTWLIMGAFILIAFGLVLIGLQVRGVSADCKAIAAMTAEVLRRTPAR
jgi:hypothetical protein